MCGHPPTFLVGEYQRDPIKNPTCVGFLICLSYNNNMSNGRNRKLFKNTTLLFITIGILNFIGHKLLLYSGTLWYDKILHFLSGFVVAMTVVLFYNMFSKVYVTSNYHLILIALLATIIVGLLWEYFEFYFDIAILDNNRNYWTDTYLDLVTDFLGGFFGARYSIKISNKNYGKYT